MLRVPDDPIREVRVLKGWISLSIFLALLGLVPFYALALGLSPLQNLLMFVVGLTLATIVVEFATRYGYRLRKRLALPNLLGVHLASMRDLGEAAPLAADLAGRWLRAEAAVLAWLDDDGQELAPIAAYGMPQGWLDSAPPLAMGHRSLAEANHRGQVIVKPSTKADPWFGHFLAPNYVLYLPLASHDRVIGVLALVGSNRGSELGDHKLLSGLGTVMALALDNCRLYQGERQRAQYMQALARMKSDFLINVSHELRTPLTSVKTAAEMLLEEEERDAPGSPKLRLVQNIVRGVSRLGSLVADLVDVSLQDDLTPRLELERVAATEVVSNALALVYPLLHNKDQAADVHLPSPGPDIMVDCRRFEQILVNLLSNAHRFTPAGGRIGISLREDRGQAVIAVSDSGPGVRQHEQECIFEPFYRGDRGGMGMGLAIAKSLVELHNGSIWVEDNPGGGSVFCVAVPHVRDADEPVAKPSVTADV